MQRTRTAGLLSSRRMLAGLLLIGVASLGLMGLGATSASAATAVPTTACVANATTGCIQGTIKQGNGDPAVGVRLTVTNGDTTENLVTDAAGKWGVAITVAGPSTVTLDTTSLPSGNTLDPSIANPATVNGGLGRNAGTIFKLVSGESTGLSTSAPSTGDSATTGSVTWERFLQQAASGIRLGLLLALASVGLSLIYGTTGLSNFAHGEQVTLGGLLAFVLANQLGLNLFLAAFLTVAVCAATGYFQDALIWKPLRKRGLPNTQLMIVTIGLSIALQYAFQFFIGAKTVRIDKANPVTVEIGPITLSVQSLWAMGIAVAVIILVGLFLLRSRIGRATRAVSDNPSLAAASGIDVDAIIRLVWTASAGLAGLAGVMLGLVLNGVNWQTGLQLLLLMFAAVTLGGLGTAFGALAGAMIIGMVVELTNLVLPGDFKYATALLILILVLLVRPQGIFGRRERIG
ncbi:MULTISPECIES: branched-chain amino acid ABC transporter permease [Cryobacterium]|uniref:Branched-chain amino acid ABC transporter permease n=1 Tax=Cryobacterium glucosi TaxID=1259175 RepID=A0ABY2IQB1_9MICO|nr:MULTISPECIES: branched-chain amino acid ABC transporter permease [Cryobacterium]MDY7529052.1 branched-chain amino acid ABC transporter permease [Cryobacterium sp. 10C2]MDY7558781.1 branched-chain amino acid ABC transporter permease [Cryobacterium sp. 10C3]MEB0001988.1 branched-chain amino acid ABC transporter permease [Cryobacterium sp. RTC2.1]MEB0203135.1 branched-chain amino acid ABC transporter permease [Cryobacterium sp. 5I3]MEB0285697.1 branched-chain amino acid ABC transporter permeas